MKTVLVILLLSCTFAYAAPADATAVQWGNILQQSATFLGVEHGFRILAEHNARQYGLGGSYTNSITNLHGWADGDPFITNYVGHPMQGAVASYIWIANDPAYRGVEIGRDPRYWKSRLRATAFSFAYSEQFELGLLSEASIGHVQRYFPQQGLVDHVVTPVIGLGWVLAEDALDKYVTRRIEERYTSPFVRIAARGLLSPSRSMSNMLALRVPWHRDDREGVASAYIEHTRPPANAQARAIDPDAPTSMELSSYTQMRRYGSHNCVGGGGEAAWRVAPEWQMVLDVGGCKMLGMPEDFSGDALTYRIGPRWSPSPGGRWSPYAELLVGGAKFSEEQLFPALKQQVLAGVPVNATPTTLFPLHDKYTQQDDTNGFSMAAATGIDMKVNRALALRVASFEYSYNWVNRLGTSDYQSGVQFSTGVVLRLGTW